MWCVEFTPDGKGLMSGSEDMTAKYWDVSSLGIYGATPGREVVNPEPSFPLIFSGHGVRCCFISLHAFCRDFHTYSAPFVLLLSSPATTNGLLPVHEMEVCVYGISEVEFGCW